MWKLTKIIILILAFGFGGLVVWMNLTPGYFQQLRCGEVGYYTDEEASGRKGLQLEGGRIAVTDCRPVSWSQSLFGVLELNLAGLDFNRGAPAPEAGLLCSLTQSYHDKNSCRCPDGYGMSWYPGEGPGPGPNGKVSVSGSGYICALMH